MARKTSPITPALKAAYKEHGYRLYWAQSKHLWALSEIAHWTGITYARGEYFTDLEYAIRQHKAYVERAA